MATPDPGDSPAATAGPAPARLGRLRAFVLPLVCLLQFGLLVGLWLAAQSKPAPDGESPETPNVPERPEAVKKHVRTLARKRRFIVISVD